MTIYFTLFAGSDWPRKHRYQQAFFVFQKITSFQLLELRKRSKRQRRHVAFPFMTIYVILFFLIRLTTRAPASTVRTVCSSLSGQAPMRWAPETGSIPRNIIITVHTLLENLSDVLYAQLFLTTFPSIWLNFSSHKALH